MKQGWAALSSGILFALGLGISGMTRPGTITAFLDFFGDWDPSLLFVMAGAIIVYSIGFSLTVKRRKPILADTFQLPTAKTIDPRLIIGSAMFGVGWALAGFCPGPALTSLMSLQYPPIVFVISMMLGMALFELNQRRKIR